MATVRDASEKRRYEEALRLSEERLRVALRASPAVVWNQDRELRYTWIHNPKDPFSSDMVLGKTDFELLPRHQAERLTAIKRAVIERGVGAREIVSVTAGSETFQYDFTAEPLRDASGEVVGVTCASWDITAQQRAEGELRLLAELGATLMSATPDYETTVSQLGRLAVRELGDWFMCDLTEAGHTRRVKVSCSDPELGELADRLARIEIDRERPHLMFEALRSAKPFLLTDVSAAHLESVAQSREHLRLLRSLRARSLVAMPLLSRGRLLGVFAIISSNESRRYQESDLPFFAELARIAALAVDNAELYRAAQRAVAVRDEVLGVVAHDLRSPLQAVLLQSQLMGRAGADPERRDRKPVEIIRHAARRMDRLIQDMLDVASLEAGALAVHPAPLEAVSLLTDVMEARRREAAEAEMEVRLEAADNLPRVLADRDRLLQVLDNLIDNAFKFTPPGGTITIAATPTAGAVRFAVIDTGVGIDPDQLPHVFDRFWQATSADRRGAGLGMPIVKGIVEAHGGQIRVESEIGRGTTVSFTLPRAPGGELASGSEVS